MKKPEEYLIERVSNNWGTDLDSIKKSIKQAQIDAYNQAIDDAVKNAKTTATELNDETYYYEYICPFCKSEHRDYSFNESCLVLKCSNCGNKIKFVDDK